MDGMPHVEIEARKTPEKRRRWDRVCAYLLRTEQKEKPNPPRTPHGRTMQRF